MNGAIPRTLGVFRVSLRDGRPSVPRNQGPWVGYISYICWVPNFLRGMVRSFRGRRKHNPLRQLPGWLFH